jgi:hypothetical protein
MILDSDDPITTMASLVPTLAGPVELTNEEVNLLARLRHVALGLKAISQEQIEDGFSGEFEFVVTAAQAQAAGAESLYRFCDISTLTGCISAIAKYDTFTMTKLVVRPYWRQESNITWYYSYVGSGVETQSRVVDQTTINVSWLARQHPHLTPRFTWNSLATAVVQAADVVVPLQRPSISLSLKGGNMFGSESGRLMIAARGRHPTAGVIAATYYIGIDVFGIGVGRGPNYNA